MSGSVWPPDSGGACKMVVVVIDKMTTCTAALNYEIDDGLGRLESKEKENFRATSLVISSRVCGHHVKPQP